jgi:hypothetical protein
MLLEGMELLEETQDRRAVTLAAAAAAAGIRTAIRLAAAGRLTATGGLTAAVAAAVLGLDVVEQTLQTTEQAAVLVALAAAAVAAAVRTAVGLAAPGIAGRLAAGVGAAIGLTPAVRLAPTIRLAAAGIAARLAAGITAAVLAEHPVKELEPERLTTDGHAESERAEEQHTLHRATSPLLVDSPGTDSRVPFCEVHRPEVRSTNVLAAGLSSQSVTRRTAGVCRPLGCPTGLSDDPGVSRGYRRAGESGLSEPKYFPALDLW